MDTEQIIADLNRRFAEPLPEFYPRRIIVWHDEEKEFVDKIDEVRLNNAKIAILTGTNYFSVKKLLAVDDTDSNYLLYSPFAYKTPEDNWLLDIELYSEEFRADLISMWLSEMGLPQTPSIRSQGTPQEDHGADESSHDCRRIAPLDHGGLGGDQGRKARRNYQGGSEGRTGSVIQSSVAES